MLRIVLGIIAGFIFWSVLWLVSEQVLNLLSPGWYGQAMASFHDAVDNKAPFEADTSILILSIIRGFLCSLAAGFLAVLISKERPNTSSILGFLLLLAGISAEVAFWNYVPLWYHLVFLLMLIPATIWGGKLVNISPRVR